jgi:hypothetical protein
MRNGLLKNILVLVICISLAFFFYQYRSAIAAEKPIVIGGSLPLTGTFSATGKWVERGYQFWLDEVNAKAGLHILIWRASPYGRMVVPRLFRVDENGPSG